MLPNFVLKRKYETRQGIATTRPAAVVQSALPILPAICLLASPPIPALVKTAKAPIIPTTVPSNPTIGAIEPTVFNILIQVNGFDICKAAFSSNPFSIASISNSSSCIRSKPPFIIEVMGSLYWSQSDFAPSMSRPLTASMIGSITSSLIKAFLRTLILLKIIKVIPAMIRIKKTVKKVGPKLLHAATKRLLS